MDLNNVISVGASTSIDTKASFSHYGATTVTLFAPGEDILGTVPTNVHSSGYISWSGTSMAAPYVAGVAALVKAIYPGMNAKAIKALICDPDNVDGSGLQCVSGGRLNAYKVLNKLSGGGTGTQYDPYQIKTVDHLRNIHWASYYHYLRLENNIDLSSYGSWTSLDLFDGEFNGNGNTISNLSFGIYNTPSWDCYFGFVAENYGTIKNLTISASIYGNVDCTYVGVFAGINRRGTIENCTSTSASGTPMIHIERGYYAGGICGYNNDGLIQSCTNTGTIYTKIDTGGIAGYTNGYIDSCTNSGTLDCYIDEGTNYIGGITSRQFDGDITYCNNDGLLVCSTPYSTSHTLRPAMAHIAGYAGSKGGGFYGNSWSTTVDKGYLHVETWVSGGATYTFDQGLYVVDNEVAIAKYSPLS